MAQQDLPSPKFEVGATVWVPYEDGAYYEARVTKRELYNRDDNQNGQKSVAWKYNIHYMGWNKKYDEWVDEAACAAERPRNAMTSSKAHKKGALASSSGAVAGGFDRPRPKLSLSIPPELKAQLVTDHDTIRSGRLVPLPRTPTAAALLDEYVRDARARQTVAAAAAGTAAGAAALASIDADEQVANGVRQYFDRCLVFMLLYKEERAQADSVLGRGEVPSTLYGPEHLLRLFVKLPDVLPVDQCTESQYRGIQARVHSLLEYISDRVTGLFLSPDDYVPAGALQAPAHPHGEAAARGAGFEPMEGVQEYTPPMVAAGHV